MHYLILSLIVLAIVSALFGLVSHLRGEGNAVVKPEGDCSTCTGENEKCARICMMEDATKPIEYFDDEELDRYAGRSGDTYTDSEVEEFAEVLYTMRPEEVKAWCRSLQLRNIHLPDQLKDETYSIVNEQRKVQ